RFDVTRQANPPQGRFVHTRVTLVESLAATGGAERGPAIADEMLGAREDGERVREIGSLESANRRPGKLGDYPGVFRKTLIGAAPADVLRDRHARRKGPLDSG